MPVGVSIASFVADGVSLLATEKTLTDHGLSMVANRDCAMWRGLKGDDICLDNTDDPYGDVLVAELPDTSPAAADQDEGMEETATGSEADPAPPAFAPISEGEVVTAAEPDIPDVLPDAPDQFVTAAGAISYPDLIEDQRPPIIEAQENAPPDSINGVTYYVIASYYRASDAERFARKQPRLDTQILSGKAKGKTVYRVAVGPIIDRTSTKRRLINSGYHDTWALKQENPDVIVEIASLE